MVRLKQWTIKQEQNLNLPISKNQPLTTHLAKIIDFLGKEIKLKEHDFDITKLSLSSLQKNPKNQMKELIKQKKQAQDLPFAIKHKNVASLTKPKKTEEEKIIESKEKTEERKHTHYISDSEHRNYSSKNEESKDTGSI